ncbi:MAG: hypothetical protein ABL876_05905 [Chitinophagaceae bacterium]
MKHLFIAVLLFCSGTIRSQVLSEIDFTYRVADWNGHLSGQFASLANSSDGSTVFAASHAGGIFRSTDGGNNFVHLKSFPSHGIKCIRYIERRTPVLIAAVQDTWLASDRRSLVWYSTDQGTTWNKSRVAAIPFGYNVPARPGTQAYDIDYSATSDIIYLASDHGLLQSTDGGVSFSYRETASTMSSSYKSNPVVTSVECGSGTRVYMAGSSGFYYSSDGGVNWVRYNYPATTVPSTVQVKNQIATVPGSGTILFLTSKYWTTGSPYLEEYLSWSNTNGSTWNSLPTTSIGDGGCGGFPSVKATRKSTPGRSDSCVLYVSNRCNFYRKSFPIIAGNAVDFANTAPWTLLNHYHADTHEITFRNEITGQDNPLYMSTDGGLHKLRSGFDYPLISGPHRGLNALLVYDMIGQTTRTSGGSDIHTVYFGTQDNLLGYFTDGLRPYTAFPTVFWEGRGLESSPYGGQLTFTAGSPYGNYRSAAKYVGLTGFNNCPGNIFWPYYVKDGCYVQIGVPPGSDPGTIGLYMTKNNGRNWWLLFSKTGEQPRVIKVVRTASSSAVIYMPVLNESGKQVFAKIVVEFPAFSVFGEDLLMPFSFPMMPSFTNFGSLGFTQWESNVFAVNPANTEHIIAPDMVSNTLKQTFDGGNTWTEITGLTRRILGEGQFDFRFDQASFISSIGFSPNGQIIVIGTAQNGVFFSRDRGVSWAKIAGSESLKNIYQPYFKPASSSRDDIQEIFFPTHGRGIWKVELPHNPTFFLVDIPYWKYYYRIPRDIGPVNGISALGPAENKTTTPQESVILFHPDSVRSVTNTPNGITVTLAERSELYDPNTGFVPLNQQQVPGLDYLKKGMKSTYPVANSNTGEKITGVAIYKNKIIALLTANEKAPYFATAKEKAAELSKKNPAYNEKKLNLYKDRFIVSEVNTGQGKRWQLLCCNIDTRNGTRTSFEVWVDKRLLTTFTVSKPGGCTPVLLASGTIPPGHYQLEIKPKGGNEVVGTVSFDVRPQDKK